MADAFNQAMLEEHNKLRAKHKVPPLKLSEKLNAVALSYAKKLAATKKFEHSPDRTYGENLYMMSSTKPLGMREIAHSACKDWYGEIKLFKFGAEPKDTRACHFSQMIWRDTTEVGVGQVYKDGTCVVVCNYNPPGNFLGHFKENVPPPS